MNKYELFADCMALECGHLAGDQQPLEFEFGSAGFFG